MIRLVYLVLAIGSWVLGSLLFDKGIISFGLINLVIVSATGWFFMMIAIGGRKGAAVGIGTLVFAACSGVLFSMLVKIPRNSLFYTLESDGLFFWLGIVGSVCLVLIIPAKITVKLWKRAGGKQAKAKKQAKEEEKKEKIYGYEGLI